MPTPPPGQLPGADWIYADEATELTPEQAARRFLDMPWADQVAYMDRVQVETAAGIACTMLNHEGAYIFATTHTCGKPAPKPAEIPVLPGQVTVDAVLGE